MQITIPDTYIEDVVLTLIARGMTRKEAEGMVEENPLIVVSQYANHASAELCALMLDAE